MKHLLLIFLFVIIFISCNSPKQTINEKKSDNSEICFGIPINGQTIIDYKRDENSILKIGFSDTIIVDVADKDYGWGEFQFPNLYRNLDNDIVATWSMGEDAVTAYGKDKIGIKKSYDNGRTWQVGNNEEIYGGIQAPNGDLIAIYTPQALKIADLQLGEPLFSLIESYGRKMTFYDYDKLPKELKGIYLKRLEKGQKEWIVKQASLNDSAMVRQADSGWFPVVWWGDMKVTPDNYLTAVTYPSFYKQGDSVSISQIVSYDSYDNGYSWSLAGKIPYYYDTILDKNGLKRKSWGYTEPAFEILQNGTYISVLRTADGHGNSPMYVSYSYDKGNNWSLPQVVTPSGVLPRLLQLKNGVLVMSSGRPGVQLRFSIDGNGKEWTNAFEMLPYEDEEAVTCGYTGLLPLDCNSFLIIYSNFKYLISGNNRKAIVVRKITIDPVI